MDLALFAKAVTRHKAAVALGLLVAVALAFLSYVRIDPFGDPMLTYRSEQLWTSRITLQITEPGFIEGQTVDPARQNTLAQLAPLYAQLANSNAVKVRMLKDGPIPGRVAITPVVDDSRASLPFIRIASITEQKSRAVERATRQTAAFRAFMAQRQAANDIPKSKRVGLTIVNGPTTPEVTVPRKKTLPIVVFMAMLVLTAALVLVLENLSLSRSRRGAEGPGAEPLVSAERVARPEPVVDKSVRVRSAPRVPRRAPTAVDNGSEAGDAAQLGGDVGGPVRPAEWRQGARSRRARGDD